VVEERHAEEGSMTAMAEGADVFEHARPGNAGLLESARELLDDERWRRT